MFRQFYDKNKILVTTFGIVAVMLIMAIVIKPIIVGYTTYQKVKSFNYSLDDYGKDINQLKTSLLISSTNLSACADLNNKFSVQLEKYLDKFSECAGELKALQVNFTLTQNSYENNLGKLQDSLDEKDRYYKGLAEQKDAEINKMKSEKEAEIDNLKTQYDTLAQNSANNICCKAKVDNPKIKHYKIDNDKVVCLEEGEKALSC